MKGHGRGGRSSSEGTAAQRFETQMSTSVHAQRLLERKQIKPEDVVGRHQRLCESGSSSSRPRQLASGGGSDDIRVYRQLELPLGSTGDSLCWQAEASSPHELKNTQLFVDAGSRKKHGRRGRGGGSSSEHRVQGR